MGTQLPFLKKGAEPSRPQFSALDHCGQTAECIKAASGTDVGLAPGHIVLDGDPALLPQKVAEPPLGGPSLLWPNGWRHQDVSVTWYGGRPQPSDFVLDGDPAPPQKGGRAPNFRPMSIMAKRLEILGVLWTVFVVT